MRRGLPLIAALGAGALAGLSPAFAQDWSAPMGANPVFETEPGAAPGHRLIVTDLRLGPDAEGATHAHPWEEFLYILEGSAILALEGQQPRLLTAGDKAVIPARARHTPKAGPAGVRAIVTRVHDLSDPLQLPNTALPSGAAFDPMP